MDIRAASEKFPWGAEPLHKLIQTSSGAGLVAQMGLHPTPSPVPPWAKGVCTKVMSVRAFGPTVSLV